jgi:hypothetical protein
VSPRRAAVLLATVLAAVFAPAVALGAVDLGPPSITGTAGDSGWFIGDVVVKWTYSGEMSTSGCDTQHLTADTPGATITCTASGAPGDTVSRTVTVRIDRTPPAGVVATPARPPDAAPFYAAPLPIAWSGTDATSGIAACTALTYAGPDGPAVAPAGSCRDRAGNVSAPLPFTFNYDTTPPALTDVVATVGADRTATLRWTAGADAQAVTVVRRPGDGAAATRTVLDGPATAHDATDGPLTPGMTYTYSVTVRDAAGNAASAATTATAPAAATTASQAKAKAKANRSSLTWRAQPKAKYYNLQLFRNGRKILSAWPTAAHYTLKPTWRYRGHAYKLAAGRYRWYVWPGYGPHAAHRYGRLLAKGVVKI